MSETTATAETPATFNPVHICVEHVDHSKAPVYGMAAVVPGLGLVVRTRVGSAWVYSRPPADARLDYDPAEVARAADVARAMRTAAAQSGGAFPVMPAATPCRHDLTKHDAVTVDPAATLDRIFEAHGGHYCWSEMDCESASDKQIKRFRDEYPAIANILGIDPDVRAFELFPLGRTLVARSHRATHSFWHIAPWRECLDRHRLGHYGEHGQHSDTPLADPEAFALGFQPIGRQNDFAILAGNGLVRSRFPIDHPLAPPSEEPHKYRLRHYVDVFTHLAGPGTRTLLIVASVRGPH